MPWRWSTTKDSPHYEAKTERKGDPKWLDHFEKPLLSSQIHGTPNLHWDGLHSARTRLPSGGGFFAALLFSTLFEYWKAEMNERLNWLRDRTTQTLTCKEGKADSFLGQSESVSEISILCSPFHSMSRPSCSKHSLPLSSGMK